MTTLDSRAADERTSDPYVRARERLDDVRGFIIHLTIYLFVNVGLFFIDLFSGDGWWFMWAAFGWGIGLFAHGMTLLFTGSRFATEWENRRIESYVRDFEARSEHHEREWPR